MPNINGKLPSYMTLFIMNIVFIIFIFTIVISTAVLPSRGIVESKGKITPTWRLETDGKKVDTIFIYQNPK